jgi:hypothetical protein
MVGFVPVGGEIKAGFSVPDENHHRPEEARFCASPLRKGYLKAG